MIKLVVFWPWFKLLIMCNMGIKGVIFLKKLMVLLTICAMLYTFEASQLMNVYLDLIIYSSSHIYLFRCDFDIVLSYGVDFF